MKKRYVVGFCFTEDRTQVVLLDKRRPEWQRGHLNGVGGKVEPGETPLEAMVREFAEECGVETRSEEWTHCLRIGHEAVNLNVFRCISDPIFHLASSTTDELVVKLSIRDDVFAPLPPFRLLSNLRWMLPMLIDPELAWSSPVEVSFIPPEPERRS